MARPQYPGAPLAGREDQHRRLLAQTANQIMRGAINSVGEVTLLENDTSTVVTDPLMHPNRMILFDPLTANAAAEIAAGGMLVALADRGAGTFTITHANAATTDRSFLYVLLG